MRRYCLTNELSLIEVNARVSRFLQSSRKRVLACDVEGNVFLETRIKPLLHDINFKQTYVDSLFLRTLSHERDATHYRHGGLHTHHPSICLEVGITFLIFGHNSSSDSFRIVWQAIRGSIPKFVSLKLSNVKNRGDSVQRKRCMYVCVSRDRERMNDE